jgi:ATP-dependent Clp protease adaptor protein ClpS
VADKTRQSPDGGTAVAEKTAQKPKLKKPPLYRVLFHNDDFTTQEFVVEVLMTVFHHPFETARRIMLQVHMKGVGVAGVYTHEIAETKAQKVMSLAREAQFPLLCTVEPE